MNDIQHTAVDATLERSIDDVTCGVHTYLEDRGEAHRDELSAAIARLDAQTARGDAYARSYADEAFLGFTGKGSVLGATSGYPMVEMVPTVVLDAQIDVVRCAKDELRVHSLTSLEALRSALSRLEAVRTGPE